MEVPIILKDTLICVIIKEEIALLNAVDIPFLDVPVVDFFNTRHVPIV
jgi:hypothetical protein